MGRQPKYKPLAPSAVFRDGRSGRPAVEGTVPRGGLRLDERFFRGRSGGNLVGTAPIRVNRQVLERGRDRFDVFCSPCHGHVGNGEGMVIQRGFRKPPSFHIDRLREVPDGYIFDVMTNGFGAMASYASRIPPDDRWAITAYIRALQLSQGARIEDVPDQERQRLLGANR
jgi:cytochrome c553